MCGLVCVMRCVVVCGIVWYGDADTSPWVEIRVGGVRVVLLRGGNAVCRGVGCGFVVGLCVRVYSGMSVVVG
jgi:hypothetical protein